MNKNFLFIIPVHPIVTSRDRHTHAAMLVILLRALPRFGREHSERVSTFLLILSSSCISELKSRDELLA